MSHPQFQAQTAGERDPVEQIIAEYIDARRRGEAPSIQSLLRNHPDLATELDEVLSTALLLEGLDPSPTLPREVIGDFRIQREIGRGGMGVVYEAEQISLRRRVALKLLTSFQGLNPEELRRFEREAALAARLDHPGLCRIHAAGVADGVPYIAMSFVEGETLAARLAGSSLNTQPDDATLVVSPRSGVTEVDPSRVLDIMEQAARALQHAHDAGIVHRDIKPANIIVTPDGQPVIVDFGLARDLEGGHSTLTRTGDVFGTPAYMAPEQIEATGRRADRRTDVFALGVTTYELLTGRRPFQGPTRVALFQAILHQNPPDPRRLRRGLPRDLTVVLETALAKHPDHRYRTAGDFAEDLRRLRAQEPILAQRTPWISRVRHWAKRRPAAAALLLTLAISIPALASTITYIVATKEQVTIAKEVELQGRVDRHTEDGYALLLDQRPGESAVRFEQALALQPDNPEALCGLAWSHLDRRDHDGALEVVRRADALAVHAPVMRLIEANVHLRAGDTIEAERCKERAGPASTAFDFYFLGIAALVRGQEGKPGAYPAALDHMTEAALRAPEARLVHALGRLRAAAWLGDPEQIRRIASQAQFRWPDDARVLYWKGVGLYRTGDVEGGVVALKQAAAKDPGDGSTWNELAEALRLSGKLDEALEAARKARKLDTDPARTAIALGLVLRDKGEVSEAREAFLEATPDPEYGPSAHMQLGGLERQVGDMKKAAAHFSEALRIDPHHPTARHGLAVVHAMDSNNAQAEIEVRRHLEDWPEDGPAWNTLGRVLGMEDRWVEAVDAFDRGASVADNRLDLLFDLCKILDTADRGLEIPVVLERLNLDKAARADPSTLEQLAHLAQKHDALEAAAALWQAYMTHPKAAPDAGAFEHAARANLRLAARATDQKTRDRANDRALRILNDALTTLRSRPLTDDDRTRLRRWTDDDPALFPLRDSPPWNTLRSEVDALLDSR